VTLSQLRDLAFDDNPLTYAITILDLSGSHIGSWKEYEVSKAVVDEENKRVTLLRGNVVS